MGKSSRVSGWEVFSGGWLKDRVLMVFSVRYLKGKEEVFREWDVRSREFRGDIFIDKISLRVESMRVGD